MIISRIFILAFIIATFDQVTKYFVLLNLNLINVFQLEVIPGIVNFHLAWNKGINFGLFSNNGFNLQIFWSVLALLIIGGLLWYADRNKLSGYEIISVGFIIGGAIGNTLDRLIQGAVIDFLNITCCGLYNPYSFNIADLVIFTGAGILLICGLQKKENTKGN